MIKYIFSSLLSSLMFYICVIIYKRYSKNIFSIINYFFYEKKQVVFKNNTKLNTTNYLKNNYKIKSSEKTNVLFKLNIIKPLYFNINNIYNNTKYKPKYLSLEQKITKSYIHNKSLFETLLYANSIAKINNLNDFSLFCGKNSLNNFNLMLKFCNKIIVSDYLYIFCKKNNLIKIKNDTEYEEIYDILSSGNKIFLIKNRQNNEHYILHGEIINIEFNINDIKKILFNDKNNKNLDIIQKYNSLQLMFFVCTKI